MAVIEPNSDIYIIKCPIELDNNNQLTFANATAQHNYFNGLPKKALTKATFQRKDGTIRWPGSMEDILEYNYCMYRNKNHGNKWFYAFIDNMEYVNDNMTAIKIRTDAWQTWQFSIVWKASYVEREHTNDDTVGANTIPEGLDTGEYVCNEISKQYYAKNQQYTPSVPPPTGGVMVCIQLTTLKVDVGGTTYQPSNPPTYNIVNGIPNGLYTIAIPYSSTVMAGIYQLTGFYDTAGKGDAIVSMFLCPRDVCGWTALQGNGIWNGGYFYKANDSSISHGGTAVTITRNSTINGYTPKNNKLFVSPYNYFHITNNAGTDIEYYYEDFDSSPSFMSGFALDQGGSGIFYPTNSKRSSATQTGGYVTQGFNEGIMAAKLPQISWQSDYYLNWQAQNGKNIAIQTGLQAAGMAIGVLNPIGMGAASHGLAVDTAVERGHFPDEEHMSVNAGGPLGAVVNFASQVANTQNAIRNAKMVPPQSKGQQGSSIQFSTDNCAFTIYKMSVRQEYAKCIDDYFSMFGYKTNRVKMPNITGRTNWNYVKTLGCNIIGDVPQGDMQEIKSIFNNGVTLWHNPSTFMDYSQSNTIIS